MRGQIGNRERIRRYLLGQSVDRAPWFLFFGPWPETEQRWREENNGIVDYSDRLRQMIIDKQRPG